MIRKVADPKPYLEIRIQNQLMKSWRAMFSRYFIMHYWIQKFKTKNMFVCG